jgi:hypothetical protein
MYHMVRFFDRKKIVRRLQRAEKVSHPRVQLFDVHTDGFEKEQLAAMEEGDKKAVRKADKVAFHMRLFTPNAHMAWFAFVVSFEADPPPPSPPPFSSPPSPPGCRQPTLRS